MAEVIDLGQARFYIDEEYYKEFFNQTAKGETHLDREVFEFYCQEFLWAFILGIKSGERTKINRKTKYSLFDQDTFKNRSKILKLITALTLQELYSDDPNKLKEDFEEATEKGENLGAKITDAIEEFANTGFSILERRTKNTPGYIENIQAVIDDILNDEVW